MVNATEIIDKSCRHIWHPCTQMKDFEQYPPLVVHKAQGSYLYTDQGALIDGISSWWCKPLGHGHPRVIAAINQQLHQFEHVIAANTTHPLLARLGEQLATISGKQHVFFANDGSSAVEIALKIAFHAKQLQGQASRNHFIALQNSYHGESFATMSISDLGVFKQPYQTAQLPCHFIKPLPYIAHPKDTLYSDADLQWQHIVPQLEAVKNTACALIVEPLIQGAGGMLLYSADFLQRLAHWAKTNDIFLIADEIMTGLCRTGKWLACEHAQIQPDLICLSKGLTAGSIPCSCVLIDHELFQLFYQDYHLGQSFLHSHTFSANALAVSAAVTTLDIMQEENLASSACAIGHTMFHFMQELASITGKLHRVRGGLGAVVAADLEALPSGRTGFQFQQIALKHGALLRPLGDSIYWLPPLNASLDTISKLAEITLHSIKDLYQ